MENIWKLHYPKYTEKVWMPSLHQVLISMSVHPGSPFFPNKLSSTVTKQQMPSLSSFFLPPLFLIMSVWHASNQAHALLLLLSHLSCLRMAWEGWGVELHIKDLFCQGSNQESVSNLQFGTGASEAPRMFDTHLVACHQTWGSISVWWQDAEGNKEKQSSHARETNKKKEKKKSKKKLIFILKIVGHPTDQEFCCKMWRRIKCVCECEHTCLHFSFIISHRQNISSFDSTDSFWVKPGIALSHS